MATVRTECAGGVVINKRGRVLVVSQRGTSWSLPKGHIEPGEEKLAAAMREVTEETGVSRLILVKPLGTYSRYKIGLGDVKEDLSELKVIHMFLFTTDEMKLRPMDPAHPQARWVFEDDVEGLLTHAKDKLFFKSIRGRLGQGRPRY